MATVSSNPTYFISYGFLFGPLNGGRLRRRLQAAGFKPAERAETADVIIAHSGGCYLLPAAAKPKLVLYVGMPLVRRKTVATYLKAEGRNLGTYLWDRHPLLLLHIFAGCLYYALTQLPRNLAIIQHIKATEACVYNDAQIVFVANRHDPWPKAADLDGYKRSKPWAFVSLPGCHDNIWEDPAAYVAIINHYAS